MSTAPAATTPAIAPIQPENIPALQRAQSRWLGWHAGPSKPNGKFDKIPVDPHSGRKINGRDGAHWRTFTEVLDAYYRGVISGIGFALSDQHPIIVNGVAFYVTVADFDGCDDAKMDECHALWRELGEPFTEVSPSNSGLHMWGLSRSPLRGGNAGGGRELYSGGRFVTMTGIGAKGVFGECPGFAALEQRWFPSRVLPLGAPPAPPVFDADFPSNPVFGSTSDNWFERLSPDDKNASLAEILRVPAVKALADTLDNAPSPNWRTVLAACARSGAPEAENLCRAWAQTSPRFDSSDFEVRWRSYARG